MLKKINPLNTFKPTEFGNGPKIPGSVAFINFVVETTTPVICIIYVNFFIFISVLRDPRITQWEAKLHFLNDRNHSQVALLKWQVQKFFCGKI